MDVSSHRRGIDESPREVFLANESVPISEVGRVGSSRVSTQLTDAGQVQQEGL